MIRLTAKIVSFFMPTKNLRKKTRRYVEISLYTASARRRAKSFGQGSIVTYNGHLSRNTVVGCNTSISSISILGEGSVVIGDNVSLGPNLTIQTQNHKYESDLLPYGQGFDAKDVYIDDCVWIGMNVMLLPGTHIGEGAIIQAGSVVHGEIPSCAIAGGNPAKVFAWRDKDRYAELCSEKKFFIHNS